MSCIQFFVAGIITGVAAVIKKDAVSVELLEDCAVPLLYCGIGSSGIAFTLQMAGQKHVEPSTASLLMSLESVFAVLSGWLVLGDTLSIWESVGCVLIFIAIMLSQIPDKKKSKV